MDSIQREVMEHLQVDWKKVKEILCGIAAALQLVCEELPGGIIKSILCGIVGVLNLICKSLPD